jgi:hypothetical protein
VSWSIGFCSCIECGVQKTWMALMVVVGGIYSPTTILAVAVDEHTGQSSGAPDMTQFTVQCLSHQQTVGVWSG